MTEKLNIDYSVCFHIDGGLGKRKATKLKSKQLQKFSKNFRLITLNKRWSDVIGVYPVVVFTELSHALGLIFRKNKPDIVFTRTFFGHFITFVAKLLSIKIIREVHSDFKDESVVYFPGSVVKQKISHLINFIEVSSIRKADGVIFNNPDLEDHFITTYGLDRKKTTSIYNASDTDMFYPESKETVRSRLGLNHSRQDKILTFTGSIVEWHGIEYLIEVFRILLEKYSTDYFLYIVGSTDAPYHQKLKINYTHVQNLKFVDKVPNDVARDYINASDVCMVTTAKILISQGSPTKMYDYIACGKPVISQKDVRGYGTVVEEHQLGIAVDFMNGPEAAQRIHEFFLKTDLIKVGRHNRKKAEEELSWCKAIEKWIRFAEAV